jgi:acetylglutamate kinase
LTTGIPPPPAAITNVPCLINVSMLSSSTMLIGIGEGKGVDAVIDKDKTSALLAAHLKSDQLIILTAVDYVITNVPCLINVSMLSSSTMLIGIGEGTTRR